MFTTLENGIGLDIVLWFQGLRFGLLNEVVNVLDFAGDELFYILIVSLIYWVFQKQLGIRMYFALIVIALLTIFFKDIFARPRPYFGANDVEPLFEDIGYGIPSGHTGMSLVMWGYLAYWLRSTRIGIAVALYVTVQGLGRLVAGVHYPQDVIAGALLGAITLAAYIRLCDPASTAWSARSTGGQMIIVLLITLFVIVVAVLAFDDIERQAPYLTLAGLVFGGGLAMMLEPRHIRFIPHDNRAMRAVHYIIGIGLAIALLIGLDVAFEAISETGLLAGVLRVIRYGTVGFFAIGLWPLITVRFGLMQQEDQTHNQA